MKIKAFFIMVLFLASYIGQAHATPISPPAVVNPYFSTPVYTNSWTYLNGTTTGGWTFAPTSYGGNSGISGNGSGGWYDPSTLPSGTTQAAFLQGGAISQTVSGFVVGQQYVVSFYDTQRPNYTVDPLTVAVGGVNLNTFIPTTTAFILSNTAPFVASSTSMLLSFNGLPLTTCATSCDMDMALTGVSVQISEPDSFLIFLCALIVTFIILRAASRKSSNPSREITTFRRMLSARSVGGGNNTAFHF